MMPSSTHNSLLGLTLQEFTDIVLQSNQPAYRAQQLFDAVYRQKIEQLDQISTLPREYRVWLGEQGWGIGMPRITQKFESRDGTVRYLVEMADGDTVETCLLYTSDAADE